MDHVECTMDPFMYHGPCTVYHVLSLRACARGSEAGASRIFWTDALLGAERVLDVLSRLAGFATWYMYGVSGVSTKNPPAELRAATPLRAVKCK